MVTVSELQVGDGARVRVGFELMFHTRTLVERDFYFEQPMWVRANYFWTVFISHDYDTIYVKFRG